MSIATLSALIGIGIFSLLLTHLPPQQQLLVPLVGIVFGNIIEAIGTFIAYETDSLQMMSIWTSGDFSGVLAGRYELLWLTAGLGWNISTSLGINYRQMTWIALIIVAMKNGEIVKSGCVGEIINPKMLKDVFNLDAEVLEHQDTPLVVHHI